MKTILLIVLLLFVTAAMPAQQKKESGTVAAKTATALKVTGYYRARSRTAPNSMEVQQLPGGKIKFHILALWVSSYNRENVHNGEVQGVVDLNGNEARFEAEHCKIAINFTARGAVVKQDDQFGDCDFGANVTATAVYRKVDSRKPKFDY